MSKKKILVAALALIVVATLSFSTLAWFTDTDEITNDFLIAGSEDNDPDEVFSVDVWEDLTDDDVEDKLQDDQKFENIQPGDKYFKEVHIENTGSYDQYVRATVTVTGASIWQDVFDADIVPLAQFVDVSLAGVDTFVTYYDAANDAFVYELYYEDILAVGKNIVVFENAFITEDLTREQAALLENFEIKVVATAVQTANVGADVMEAFETTGMLTEVADAIVATPVATFEELQAVITAGGVAILEKDIAATGNAALNVAEGTTAVFDLNGFTYTSKDADSGANSMAIKVNRNATLTLEDSVGTGKVASSCYGVYVQPSATFVQNGGEIEVTGNGTYDFGVVVWNATYTMNGGSIDANEGIVTSNYWQSTGEACPVNTVTLNGGTISALTVEIDTVDAPDTIIADNR